MISPSLAHLRRGVAARLLGHPLALTDHLLDLHRADDLAYLLLVRALGEVRYALDDRICIHSQACFIDTRLRARLPDRVPVQPATLNRLLPEGIAERELDARIDARILVAKRCTRDVHGVGAEVDGASRLDEVVEKAWCLNALSNLLYEDNQFDAAEEAISRCITLLPEEGQGFLVCRSHRVLGRICRPLFDRTGCDRLGSAKIGALVFRRLNFQ